MEGNMK